MSLCTYTFLTLYNLCFQRLLLKNQTTNTLLLASFLPAPVLRGWFYTVIHAYVNRQHSHANYINLEVFPVNCN